MATRARVGFVSGRGAEAAFVWMMRIAGVLLLILGIVGNFYGLRNKDVEALPAVIVSLVREWPWLLAALGAQVVLSIIQWGCRQRALGHFATNEKGQYLVDRRDKRVRVGGIPGYWLFYAGSLVASAALSWAAYDKLLVVEWGWPWLLALFVVASADAAAEIAVVVSD